jgi:hypothetical protein
VSLEVKKQYEDLDKKYKLEKEHIRLKSIPRLRRSIVTGFMNDLREAQATITDNNYSRGFKKVTIQRFLERLNSTNDNGKSYAKQVKT